MNFNNFTIKSQEAVQKAVEITSANGQPGYRAGTLAERCC